MESEEARRWNAYLQSWCQQIYFQQAVQRAVREAVSTEFFWRDFFETDYVKREMNKIPSMVDRQVSTSVQNELVRTINPAVSNRCKELVTSMLPMEILKQLPVIIAQNGQFQDMFRAHTNQLEDKLTERGHKVLNELVNGPNYHILTEKHLNAIADRGDQAIQAIRTRSDKTFGTADQNHKQQMAQFDREWKNNMEKIQNDVSIKLQSITTLEARVNSLERDNNDLKSSNTWLKVGLVGLTAGVGYLTYLVNTIKK